MSPDANGWVDSLLLKKYMILFIATTTARIFEIPHGKRENEMALFNIDLLMAPLYTTSRSTTARWVFLKVKENKSKYSKPGQRSLYWR